MELLELSIGTRNNQVGFSDQEEGYITFNAKPTKKSINYILLDIKMFIWA